MSGPGVAPHLERFQWRRWTQDSNDRLSRKEDWAQVNSLSVDASCIDELAANSNFDPFYPKHLPHIDNHNALGIQTIKLVLNYYGLALERLGIRQRKFLLVPITKDQYPSDPASNEGHWLSAWSLEKRRIIP